MCNLNNALSRPTHLIRFVSNKTTRFLMLWLFVALQAMTPFIHAHAGAVQLDHAGFLHAHHYAHQGAHSDAVYHASATDEHGAEVGVAQAMPMRSDTQDLDVPLAIALALPGVHVTARSGAGMQAPPPLLLALPDHTLPHALAPPSA